MHKNLYTLSLNDITTGDLIDLVKENGLLGALNTPQNNLNLANGIIGIGQNPVLQDHTSQYHITPTVLNTAPEYTEANTSTGKSQPVTKLTIRADNLQKGLSQLEQVIRQTLQNT